MTFRNINASQFADSPEERFAKDVLKHGVPAPHVGEPQDVLASRLGLRRINRDKRGTGCMTVKGCISSKLECLLLCLQHVCCLNYE